MKAGRGGRQMVGLNPHGRGPPRAGGVGHVAGHEVWYNTVKWIEVNWSEVKWSEVIWSEVNWSELKWIEVEWSEVKWSGVKWSEVKWSEVKWSELKWTISWTFIPLWWHRKFQNMSRSATHNTPISDAELFPTCAWSHRYIGRGSGKTEIPLLDSERYWISKTEGSPIGFIAILWRLKTCKIAVVKVVDFDHLRALFGPGAPDADLSIFKLGFSHELIMRNTARWIHTRAALNTCTQSFRWIHVRRHTESHTTMH